MPERQYVKLLSIVQRQGGAILARTIYELSAGTQVNAIFQPDGLGTFDAEFKGCRVTKLEGQPVRELFLQRVIASKRAAGSEKDVAALPVLERTLRLARRLTASRKRRKSVGKSVPKYRN